MTLAMHLVMVVEDDKAMQEVLRILFEGSGFRVVVSETARQGENNARLHRPDIVVVDLALPDGDGISVIKSIRVWSPMPIIVLSARADRIEHRRDGSYAVLDYKTGQPPTGKQVRMGLSPQLTLEAAILREGGFEGILAGSSVSELVYVRISGNNPPGEQKLLELKIKPGDTAQSPDAAADNARAQLEALIRKFENEDEPYRSLNLPMWTNRYGVYDDLSRIKEWSAAGGLEIPEW